MHPSLIYLEFHLFFLISHCPYTLLTTIVILYLDPYQLLIKSKVCYFMQNYTLNLITSDLHDFATSLGFHDLCLKLPFVIQLLEIELLQLLYHIFVVSLIIPNVIAYSEFDFYSYPNLINPKTNHFVNSSIKYLHFYHRLIAKILKNYHNKLLAS